MDSIHCASCKVLIEDEVAEKGGKAIVDIGKKTVEIEFNEKKTKLENIQEALRKVGHDSEVIG